jgi:AcrR family transcriptional regulator
VDGKEGLLAAIHEWRMRDFLDGIRASRDAHADTLEAHLAVLLDGADFFVKHPDFLRLCCRDGYGWASPATSNEAAVDLWKEGIAIPTQLFERGVEEGIYVDEPPGLLARKMLALKQVELTHWVEEGMRAPSSEVRTRLRSQFLRAFCRPGVELARAEEEKMR